jgi:hypothetical protein
VTSPSSATPDRASVTLSFFGRAVLVDVGASLADVLAMLWKPFVLAPAAAPTDPSAISNAVPVCAPRHDSSEEDLAWLNTALNSTAMELAPHLAVHAGVVRRGAVVVAFPARSGIGKSTLTGACLREGFDYVSDEALCLSYDDKLVHPYPRPIGLSPWSARELGVTGVQAGDDVLVLPQEFGARSTPTAESLRLTNVVLPRRLDNGAPASLVPATASEAIETLLRMSFNHYRRPVDAMRLIASVVAEASVMVMTYSNAGEAAALMAQAFSVENRPVTTAPGGASPLVDKLSHL